MKPLGGIAEGGGKQTPGDLLPPKRPHLKGFTAVSVFFWVHSELSRSKPHEGCRSISKAPLAGSGEGEGDEGRRTQSRQVWGVSLKMEQIGGGISSAQSLILLNERLPSVGVKWD